MTKGLNKITQNETQDLQLVDNFCKSWETILKFEDGAQRRNRTADTGIFNPLLYRLSYLGNGAH